MRKSFLLPAVASLLLITTAFSCKREDSCSAGTGGDLTIVAYPQHHTKPIHSQAAYPDTVFVKFNTQDAPGQSASDYDTYFVGEAGEDHVHLTGLKCGSYYLFGTGYDTSINQRVVGGIPFSTDKTSGELSINIPVTEGD